MTTTLKVEKAKAVILRKDEYQKEEFVITPEGKVYLVITDLLFKNHSRQVFYGFENEDNSDYLDFFTNEVSNRNSSCRTYSKERIKNLFSDREFVREIEF